MNKRRTFSILGVRYNAPASLDENIREWFAHNAPTAACDLIPADARFTAVHAALTPSTAAPLPAWCVSIDSTARNLIYYSTAVTACGITTANRKNKKNTVFPEKMCVFLASSTKSTYLCSDKKEKEVTTIKTGGNCNSAPRL